VGMFFNAICVEFLYTTPRADLFLARREKATLWVWCVCLFCGTCFYSLHYAFF
jgi:hypothetical protein